MVSKGKRSRGRGARRRRPPDDVGRTGGGTKLRREEFKRRSENVKRVREDGLGSLRARYV